jgi:ribonuclease BN (tRNA processing enzyme)
VRRRFDVRVVEHVDGRPFELDGLRVIPFEVRHASGAPAYALRVESDGASAAYSGDTEWTDALLGAADGVEVFLCEGYSETPIRWHLDLDTLSRHRDRLTCRKLVLTHLSPSALALDLRDWTVAYDGLGFDLK